MAKADPDFRPRRLVEEDEAFWPLVLQALSLIAVLYVLLSVIWLGITKFVSSPTGIVAVVYLTVYFLAIFLCIMVACLVWLGIMDQIGAWMDSQTTAPRSL